MIVTLQRKIVFENACGVLVNLEDLEKAILSDFRSPFASRHKIYIHAKYPAVSMRNDKVHIHRLLAKYWYGSENIHGMYVHHKDGNKLNCLKDNLEIISISNHQSMHNVGKTISEEQKESIRKFNRNRNGLKRNKFRSDITIEKIKKLLSDGYSMHAISKTLNCSWDTVRDRIHDNPELLGGSE